MNANNRINYEVSKKTSIQLINFFNFSASSILMILTLGTFRISSSIVLQNLDKMENQPICIVCAKACLTVNDHITCIDCLRSLHKSCSTSKISVNLSTNKKLVRSCLLCDSRTVDASFDKHFDSTRPDNFTLGTCDENSNYCGFVNNCEYYDISSLM